MKSFFKIENTLVARIEKNLKQIPEPFFGADPFFRETLDQQFEREKSWFLNKYKELNSDDFDERFGYFYLSQTKDEIKNNLSGILFGYAELYSTFSVTYIIDEDHCFGFSIVSGIYAPKFQHSTTNSYKWPYRRIKVENRIEIDIVFDEVECIWGKLNSFMIETKSHYLFFQGGYTSMLSKLNAKNEWCSEWTGKPKIGWVQWKPK